MAYFAGYKPKQQWCKRAKQWWCCGCCPMWELRWRPQRIGHEATLDAGMSIHFDCELKKSQEFVTI